MHPYPRAGLAAFELAYQPVGVRDEWPNFFRYRAVARLSPEPYGLENAGRWDDVECLCEILYFDPLLVLLDGEPQLTATGGGIWPLRTLT